MKNTIKTAYLMLVFGALAALGFGSAYANDAGCGLGSLIIQSNAKLSQSLALTTNATFSSQLFGITSGTSNCSASGLAMNDQKAAVYAEANFQSIRIDMARGQGESLTAFAELLGCDAASVNLLGQMTQAHYTEIYSNDQVTPIQMVKTVRSQLSNQAELSKSCNASTI